jgi:Bacterial Ig domain
MIPLAYDARLDQWVGNATMPSPYNPSFLSTINGNAEYYGGPYDIYVAGLSADGMPTNSSLSAQQPFFVQPYVYSSNSTMTDLEQSSGLALQNVTINAGSSPLVLSDDVFVGTDNVTGSDVTITSSVINGTLNVSSGQTTLNDVDGGGVMVTGANLILLHSTLSSVDLGPGATASVDPSSSYQSITPALPVITITAPTANASYTGTVDAEVGLKGSSVQVLTFILDGKQLPSLLEGAPPGPQVSYPINTTALPDGTHTLTVIAVQADLLTTSASVTFVTHNQLQGVTNELSNDSAALSTANKGLSSADSDIASLQGNLDSANHTISNLLYVAYLSVAVAVVALVIGLYGIRGARGTRPT